jgi:hypothetical protein
VNIPEIVGLDHIGSKDLLDRLGRWVEITIHGDFGDCIVVEHIVRFCF